MYLAMFMYQNDFNIPNNEWEERQIRIWKTQTQINYNEKLTVKNLKPDVYHKK